MILGVDLSHWNGKPDCQKLADNNVKFGIVKAGEVLVHKPNKPLYYDSMHDRNIIKLQEAGIITGDYYYWHPSAGVSVQARHYVEIYKRMKPDLPPVVDVEDRDGMKPADVRTQLLAFISRLQDDLRVAPIVYSRNGFLVNECGNPDWPDGVLFWIARYASKIGDLSPKIKDKVIIWQYTDKLKIPGVPVMDGNYWLRSEDELEKLAGRKPIPILGTATAHIAPLCAGKKVREWLDKIINGV
jgi:lysozyme